MTTLEVRNLVKRFHGTQQSAVNDISFELSGGEILALVGPSGCGKTTTLRIIAGLERPDSGTVCLNNRLVASESVFVPPEKRGVGMVFQDHALFPHLTVSENIAFGLRGQSADQVKKTVGEMLHLVGLLPLAKRYPHALSGGERQRVALARALAPRPVLVLMDEPFSSLDADLRMEMREHVRRILKSMQATVVFVTHDQEEALYMGDRLAVLNEGHLEQIGTPEKIFHESTSRFVAEFMGDSNFLKGKVTPGGIQTLRPLREGVRRARQILAQEHLPYVLPIVFSTTMNNMNWSIGLEVTLSVLGFTDINTPTIGVMIYWANQHTALVAGIWWWILFPVALVMIAFIGLFLLAVSMNEYIDPRSRLARIGA